MRSSEAAVDRNDGSAQFRQWLDGPPKRNQEQVAAQLGVAQQTVSSWARGKCPTILHRVKIKRLTGIPVEAWVAPGMQQEERLTDDEEQAVLDADDPPSSERVPTTDKGAA